MSESTGKRYSTEFKEEAVRMILDRGQSMNQIAQQLGVTVHSLRAWKGKHTTNPSPKTVFHME